MAARNNAAKEKRPAKRAHRSLTIDQKIEILDQIGKKSYKICRKSTELEYQRFLT